MPERFYKNARVSSLSARPGPIHSTEKMNPERKQHMKRIALTTLALAFGLAASSWAQNATPSTDDSFAKYGQEFKGKIGRTYAESVEWYPEQVKPKPGTPNGFMILLAAMGFAQSGCFG